MDYDEQPVIDPRRYFDCPNFIPKSSKLFACFPLAENSKGTLQGACDLKQRRAPGF